MTIFSVANIYSQVNNYTISFSFNNYFVAYQTLVCYHYTCLIFRVASFFKLKVNSFFYAFWWFFYFEEFSAKSRDHRLNYHFFSFSRIRIVNLFLFNLVASLFWVCPRLKVGMTRLQIGFRFWWYRFRFYSHEWFQCYENFFNRLTRLEYLGGR